MNDELLYWPFETRPPDQQTDQEQREIRFLQTAHDEGFQPYTFSTGNFGAGDETNRWGWIVARGRVRWEIVLGLQETKMFSACVDDFACASDAVLLWLRGVEANDILPLLREHLVMLVGARQPYWLNDAGKGI